MIETCQEIFGNVRFLRNQSFESIAARLPASGRASTITRVDRGPAPHSLSTADRSSSTTTGFRSEPWRSSTESSCRSSKDSICSTGRATAPPCSPSCLSEAVEPPRQGGQVAAVRDQESDRRSWPGPDPEERSPGPIQGRSRASSLEVGRGLVIFGAVTIRTDRPAADRGHTSGRGPLRPARQRRASDDRGLVTAERGDQGRGRGTVRRVDPPLPRCGVRVSRCHEPRRPDQPGLDPAPPPGAGGGRCRHPARQLPRSGAATHGRRPARGDRFVPEQRRRLPELSGQERPDQPAP